MLFSSHEVTTQTCARTQPCGQKKKRDESNFDQNKDLPFELFTTLLLALLKAASFFI